MQDEEEYRGYTIISQVIEGYYSDAKEFYRNYDPKDFIIVYYGIESSGFPRYIGSTVQWVKQAIDDHLDKGDK